MHRISLQHLRHAVVAAAAALVACDGSYTVGVPSIHRVRVALERPAVAVGDSIHVVGEAFDRNGEIVQRGRRMVVLRSADSSVAVAQGIGAGFVRGVAVGTTYVVGASGGAKDSVLVQVTPAP